MSKKRSNTPKPTPQTKVNTVVLPGLRIKNKGQVPQMVTPLPKPKPKPKG